MDDAIIRDSTDSRFREWLSLRDPENVRTKHRTIVAGTKTVPELLRLRPGCAAALLMRDRHEAPAGENTPAIPRHIISGALFRELDVFGTDAPLLVADIPEIPAVASIASRVPAILLPFADPSVLGAVIRSAAAFGIRRGILTGESALPFEGKALRTGGTAVFLMEYLQCSWPPAGIGEGNIVLIDSGGDDVREFGFPESMLLVPGMPAGENEAGAGNFGTNVRSIRITPSGDRLAPHIEVGIALYEWSRRKRTGHDG